MLKRLHKVLKSEEKRKVLLAVADALEKKQNMIRLENGADVAVATRYYKSVISRLSLTLRPVSRPIPQMVYLCLNGFLLCIDQIMRLRCSMQPPQSIGTSAPLSRIVHLEREQQVLHVKPKAFPISKSNNYNSFGIL
ncbi:unnamed protein product [Trifolium pratense]|uniref:Uncharacterized protein n=1 Tax=Trifolium pratense TaxID=57577 RepID=A0ACB0JU53_TRIPR|nr:unnamed protein product [Trifolium pratense]